MADEMLNVTNCDFHGWATKNNVRCSDGRTIMRDAFADNDGADVPLVWNHKHDSPYNVLGHARLENRDEGVYAYCAFNDTDQGRNARLLVQHGDVKALSIYANGLKQDPAKNVKHGVIREVSLVLAGANPQALIQSVMAHSEDNDLEDDEIYLSLSGSGCDLSLDHSEIKEDASKDQDEEDKEDEDSKKKDSDEKKEPEKKEDESDDLSDEPDKDELEHAQDSNKKKEESTMADETKKTEAQSDEETVGEVFDTLSEKQKNVVYYMIGEALKNAKSGNADEGGEDMKHNLFEQEGHEETQVLTHADMEKIFADAKRCGSLREAVKDNLDDGVLAHSIDTTGMETATGTQRYGFNDASMLFPEFKALSNTPEWISRNMDWVNIVLNGVHRSPFSRIKSVFANITEDEARAKGYFKGNPKKDEVFSTLKRTTEPQTIYKRQKLDRDDIIDITDFDAVAWIRGEMRLMLNEEIARAILIGDGRLASSDDKILENHIRPICSDVPLFNTKIKVTAAATDDDETIAKAIIKAAVRGRKNYKGSGSPTLFTSEEWLTEMLLLEDGIGHKLYKTEQELASALRVKNIVTVEPMETKTLNIESKDYPLIGIIVNLADYNVGADKGGAVNMFDDFDIDYNQQKYLIETRCSGALIKPYSALTLYLDKATA